MDALDRMRGRRSILFLGTSLAPELCLSLLETAYGDKVMAARVFRVATTKGAYVDARSLVRYDSDTRDYRATIWQSKREDVQMRDALYDAAHGITYSPDDGMPSIFTEYNPWLGG